LSRLRTLQKRASIAAAKPNASEVPFLISEIDKAAKRGIIHKNAAIRRKARLSRLLGKPATA
jgi:ribosomal protein S20